MNSVVRKITAGILLAVVVFSLSYATYASYDVRILINGNEIKTSQEPVIMDGTTLVPLRDVFENLGAKVSWDDSTRTATGEYGGTVVSVHPDSGSMKKNGVAMSLNHAPVIINDRILIPLRAVAESFGYNVLWRGSDYTVSITTGNLMNMYVLDCGQADSIFVELPDGKCMLVDAGEKSFGKTLVEFIKGKGYSHIDYVVATHPHSDHIGGMKQVIESFSIGTFYMPDITHNTKTFEGMIDALTLNGCKCEFVSQGSIIPNDICNINVLAPQSHKYSKMNDYSVVLKLTYGQVDIILSGDAETSSEWEITQSGANINAEILKIGHHGSKSSTGDIYVGAISPDDALISVGEGNSYGFPDETVLRRLEDRNIKIYRTDINGNIMVNTDGYVYDIRGDK